MALRRATQALFPQLRACRHTSSAVGAACSTSGSSIGISSRRGLSTDDKPTPKQESLTTVASGKAKEEEWVEVDDAASGKTYW